MSSYSEIGTHDCRLGGEWRDPIGAFGRGAAIQTEVNARIISKIFLIMWKRPESIWPRVFCVIWVRGATVSVYWLDYLLFSKRQLFAQSVVDSRATVPARCGQTALLAQYCNDSILVPMWWIELRSYRVRAQRNYAVKQAWTGESLSLSAMIRLGIAIDAKTGEFICQSLSFTLGTTHILRQILDSVDICIMTVSATYSACLFWEKYLWYMQAWNYC